MGEETKDEIIDNYVVLVTKQQVCVLISNDVILVINLYFESNCYIAFQD